MFMWSQPKAVEVGQRWLPVVAEGKVAPAVVAPEKAAARAPTPGAVTSTTAGATSGVGAAAVAAIPFGKGMAHNASRC